MDPKDVPGYGNGGPAFPNDIAMNTLDRGGMTLRDYFAAKAMQAWLSTFTESRHPTENGGAPEVARSAYMLADAMLTERAKATGEQQ